MKKKKLGLSAKVFIGFGLGIILGIIFKEKVLVLKPVGDMFLRLIKMIVVPLILFSITAGVCSIGDMQKLKRIGSKTLLYYLFTTTLAGGISLTIANVINPGKGLSVEEIVATETVYEAAATPSVGETILQMIPDNIFTAFTTGNLMQIIVFSLFVGIAIIIMGDRGVRVRNFFESGAEIMYTITGMVMETSPYGVAALIACSVGAYGMKIFGPLAIFIGTVYLALISVILMYAVMLKLIGKVSLRQFFRKIPELWLVTSSTTSSSGSLPITLNVAKNKFGVAEELSSFTLPLGATMNMNGGVCFYAASVIFVSQIYGIELSFTQQAMTVLMATLVSVGAPGIPGGAIVMSTMLLSTMGLPLDVVGMIAGIFRLIDMGTTTINVTGDVVSTICIARGENMIDYSVYNDSTAKTTIGVSK
ncbi:dicarboxylate/amino acid:cation symporter [Tissierella praeacuta]|uniref:Na+/H+-dicarboxylate symporter n=1 Tax=Tissierella praeacuta DSM 18095 TaxID=1123404 RepID=A0A1M4TIN3_9FIRM|nr:dicarboxylate/amino acid:cation symporter [Tissierella praeacuta]HAE92447.1 dicarboxylate/amino acid:cation symporter [Tissierella sp.]MBU5256919.1 dicarboxylate/amino acid:cation symporter [Tissierella praeacuta]TCU77500.1 Na+/H+-dicarboxylate symporter [Tissierella praeacuta]SHE44330.1 Na+/H+-dicarboxylate symporter [Tissierella praeacuta DSM 18095]SUP04595.1 Glutamate-aspartate carrier protein [Tissierella praeacuta]